MAPLLWLGVSFAANPSSPPLQAGAYSFQWKDAEFPSGLGFPVKVVISGRHVVVKNEHARGEIPVGALEEGVLMWHASSGHWIIGHEASDATAKSVGGCGDVDPAVVDFKARVIWTCMWGP
jgi:hypothetical protein